MRPKWIYAVWYLIAVAVFIALAIVGGVSLIQAANP